MSKALKILCQLEAGDNSPDEFGAHTDWVMEHADHTINTAQPRVHVFNALDQIVAFHEARLGSSALIC